MSGKSNYLEGLILNWAYNGQAMPSAPASVYVGLFNGDPGDDGLGGTEVTTTIRAAGRVAASFGSVVSGPGADAVANDALVDFGSAEGAATFSHFGTFDAASAGNMLHYGPIADGSDIVVGAGTAVRFPVGDLDITEN